jgi:MFS family permease
MDYLGMALLAAGTTSLVLVGTWGGSRYDWDSPVILGLIGATVLAAGLFALVESKVAEPIMPLRLFRDRNFTLATVAGLLTGVGMFGAIGYMPTYLQMTTEVSATEAGLLMVPMMGFLLITSVLSGVLVSRTGRYKWLPIAGSGAIAAAMVLLSTMTTTMPLWEVCAYLALLGVGLGVSMQLLVLIVQNSFPARQVGTATAAHNYFRQIGASLGSAVVGSLFATRLVDELAQRLPGGIGTEGGATSLTPEIVNSLPDAIRSLVVASYNDALTPIFLVIAPLSIVATILLFFIHEKPLATTIEREIPAESLAEGQLLVALHDEPGSEDGRRR